jgi:hypothetical protein
MNEILKASAQPKKEKANKSMMLNFNSLIPKNSVTDVKKSIGNLRSLILDN